MGAAAIEELTIDDIALSAVTLGGRSEDDIWSAYQRKCFRFRIIPIWGQLRAALSRLHKAGKVSVKKVNGVKVCFKVR